MYYKTNRFSEIASPVQFIFNFFYSPYLYNSTILSPIPHLSPLP